MALTAITDWLDEYDRPGFVWYVKRLAANDTLAKSNQVGPYLSKGFLFRVFPSLNTTAEKNPDARFDLYIDSHPDHRRARAIYYNTRPRGQRNGRNETRITRLGGRQSALLDPESTGALTVFAFAVDEAGRAIDCHVWVCRHGTEEDVVEELVGPIEPGEQVIWKPGVGRRGDVVGPPTRANCFLTTDEIPPAWRNRFPTGEEIISKAIELRNTTGMDPDLRLIRRRKCEYEIFRSIEQAIYLPRVLEGFTTVDSFVGLAQTVLQSRKSRSGNSLELHARKIFIEEGLRSMQDFQHKPFTEEGKRPDFLFPSQAAYDDPSFPSSRLRMLAAKTTCKDRWRQITHEADRIATKHLLTLQEGVSEAQFREMLGAGVQLVVPTGLHESFPAKVQPYLMSLESFIADVRLSTI